MTEEQRRTHERRDNGEAELPAEARVREGDLEPFSALRYIARLFKFLAILLALLLIAEVVLGLAQGGSAALANILVDATRLLVFAAFLWAGGDLALMFVETNHDLRATRILVGRLTHEVELLRGALGRDTGPSGTRSPGERR